MFTLPRKIRLEIDNNKLVQAVLPSVLGDATAALSDFIDNRVEDPNANRIAKIAIATALAKILK
jgi:hypothetical protein